MGEGKISFFLRLPLCLRRPGLHVRFLALVLALALMLASLRRTCASSQIVLFNYLCRERKNSLADCEGGLVARDKRAKGIVHMDPLCILPVCLN